MRFQATRSALAAMVCFAVAGCGSTEPPPPAASPASADRAAPDAGAGPGVATADELDEVVEETESR